MGDLSGPIHVDPTREQAEAFAASAATEWPVFMLNLLRFKDEADGVAASEGISGAEAYARYAGATEEHLARVGAEIVWAGACGEGLIGPETPEWDVAALVRYPSRRAFLEMVGDPEYLETSKLRTAAIADSRLIPCGQGDLGPLEFAD
jgi:uncharacterized protein (DUF1330 family)